MSKNNLNYFKKEKKQSRILKASELVKRTLADIFYQKTFQIKMVILLQFWFLRFLCHRTLEMQGFIYQNFLSLVIFQMNV